MHKELRDKILERFDTIAIPRTLSINDLCLALGINLTLTSGSGFYQLDGKEKVGESRKIVLRSRETGEFTDDFTCKNKGTIYYSSVYLQTTSITKNTSVLHLHCCSGYIVAFFRTSKENSQFTTETNSGNCSKSTFEI